MVYFGKKGIRGFIDEPIRGDKDFSKLIQWTENRFCIGRPVSVNGIFRTQWRSHGEPWNKQPVLSQEALMEIWYSIRGEDLTDINSAQKFRDLLDKEYGPYEMRIGEMYSCKEEAYSYTPEEVESIEEQINDRQYPFPRYAVLRGTNCLLLKQDWFLFKDYTVDTGDVFDYYLKDLRTQAGMKPIPEVYAVRKFEFLCFHPEIAKKHEDPPKHLNPKAFRSEEPHIRTVFAEPVSRYSRDRGYGLIWKNFELLKKKPNLSY